MLPLLALSIALANDPDDDHDLLPARRETAEEIRQIWSSSPAGWVSEVRSWAHPGSRVGAIVEAPPGRVYVAEARGVRADGSAGPWVPLRETFANDELRVWVAELGGKYPAAQVRVGGALPPALGWELREPVSEPRRPSSAPPPPSSALSQTLRDLGVVSRDSWGARATTCSSTEDDWYRMAIHHTAGNTTYGGTVQGAVQALQAYAMDSGDYCDIPYQFLVGYDGSLWEGRELTYTSGATGGGNNGGNIAMCFLGCFHPNSCPGGAGDDATDAMMAWGRILIRTLASEHGFSVDSDTIRGHQDWPGNSTACPGDYVMSRFDELLSASARFQGSFAAQSFPLSPEALVLAPGEEQEGWIELTNTGTDTWTPGWTWLAPTPRDTASALAAGDWSSATRAATVAADVPPGAVGRFTFSVRGPDDGVELTQRFTLVQEWFTWFADRPYGGGPADDGLSLTVRGEAADPGDDSNPDTDPDPDDPGLVGRRPGEAALIRGLGCATAPGAGAAATLLALGLLRRRAR